MTRPGGGRSFVGPTFCSSGICVALACPCNNLCQSYSSGTERKREQGTFERGLINSSPSLPSRRAVYSSSASSPASQASQTAACPPPAPAAASRRRPCPRRRPHSQQAQAQAQPRAGPARRRSTRARPRPGRPSRAALPNRVSALCPVPAGSRERERERRKGRARARTFLRTVTPAKRGAATRYSGRTADEYRRRCLMGEVGGQE